MRIHCLTGILDRAAELSRRIAEDVVAIAIEHGNLISMRQESFATFVVEGEDEIRLLQIVCDGQFRTPLIERLYDFGGLRSCSASHPTATTPAIFVSTCRRAPARLP
jgi:hypothetical protein